METEYIALTDNNYVPLTQAQISLCAKIGYTSYTSFKETYRTHMHVSDILRSRK